MTANPLLTDWNEPFDAPPFHLFETALFKPAIIESIRSATSEIKAIAENTAAPDFENTIAALDRAGRKLDDVTSVLFNLNNAETSREMQAVAQEVSPLLTRFSNDITMNEALFRKVKTLYDSRNSLDLTTEELMLLEKNFRNFMLGGAGLDPEKKEKYREISEELSTLTVKFEENILDDTNAFELHITDEGDLSGLPDGIMGMASLEARERKKEGWVFTLHFPSYMPFMKYSARRDLREKMYRAYASRAFHNDSHDNRELSKRIANLRLELAKITGFRNYAELVLGDRMAETTARVESFLEELHLASSPAAHRDFGAVKEFAEKCGHTGRIERWDWAYYSEKLQKAKYDIDDEALKPYFVLGNAEKAIFELAGKLYGLSFMRNNDIPVYNHEVSTWEVRDADGAFLSILYIDYFPRPGKIGGAWMTSFREQRIENGNDIRPLISIVANFTRPTETSPSLLTFNELTTFLHEFGHALHGMLSRCTYESISGTSVARDFVELPSQFMENYAYEKEWLSEWARHYITGEPISDEMISRIKESSTFNEGYACNRQLGFGFLDMAWHTLTSPLQEDIIEFETAAMQKTELFPQVEGTGISVSFGHIFGGGYAAGYYGYKWAEVLDADAFMHFRESGIFNRETALSFRKNILEKGGTDKPMNLYKGFRGKEPAIDAFLERSGLK
ncbi:MAG: M3 family metallopeptidase [Bacteroidales bacterium]|jgi:peptidyl-dipeptidase Dcp|nr:M3 family metallopeptidase [Bacteroidales bacterium]